MQVAEDNPATWVSGAASSTGNTAVTLIAAPSSQYYIAVRSIHAGRSDAGATAITVLLNDMAGTEIVVPNAGSGGGNNMSFDPPLQVAKGYALTFTPSAGVTTLYMNAQGFLII